jgi:DNA-binding transcriptional LysR family regulator
MNLNQLYYFIKLAEVKHFTKAAQELHISQPSLSYSISTLEDELGTSLIQKTGRIISLTENGREFLKYADASIAELERGIKIVKKNEEVKTGKVDVGYIYTIGSSYLPKLIREYLKTYHYETNFDLYSTPTAAVIEGLKSGKFDIGFCSYVENEPDLQFFPVLSQKVVVIVPPNHELAKYKKVTLLKVSSYPIVTYNSHSNSLGILLKNIFNRYNITPNVVCQLNDETSIGGFVSEGFGVGIIEDLPLVAQFNLKVIPLDVDLQTRVVYCAYNKRLYQTGAIRSFLEFVKQKELDRY